MLLRKVVAVSTQPQLIHNNFYRASYLAKQYKKLLAICKPQASRYILNSVITLVHAGLFMYLPKIYGDLNHVMSLTLENTAAEQIYTTYLLMTGKWAGIFLAMGMLTYRRRYQFLDIANRIAVRLRLAAYEQILSRDFFRSNQSPQAYLHHLITDIKAVSDFTGQTIFIGLRGLLFVVGGSCCLIYSSPYLCLLTVGIMGIFNIIFKGRNILLKDLKQKQNLALIRISQFAGQRLYNIKLIRISNTQAFENLFFIKELNKFYEYSKQVAKANGLNVGGLQGAGLFSLFLIAISGSFLISMQLTSFSLIASSTYAMYVALGFRSLFNFNNELMKIMAVYKNIENRICSIHELPSYTNKEKYLINSSMIDQKIKQLENQMIEHQNRNLGIKIQNISYTYYPVESEKWIYNDFNYQIKPGSCVALIGPSGTGKTSLFNLLTKLSFPNKGQIFLDGKSLSSLTFADIHRMISYVTQQHYLIKGSIRQNLKYGNHGFDCSDQRLFKCLKMTNAYDFVLQKGGLSSIVQQKGNNLSGGEKQRLVLARALVKHPRLLLLDEATAGVDSQSQRMIVESLKNNRNQMTIMIITHRLENFRSIITDIINLGDLQQ